MLGTIPGKGRHLLLIPGHRVSPLQRSRSHHALHIPSISCLQGSLTQDVACHWRHLSRVLLFVCKTGLSGEYAIPCGLALHLPLQSPASKGTSITPATSQHPVLVFKSETLWPLNIVMLDVGQYRAGHSQLCDSGAALAAISEMPGHANRKMRSENVGSVK